MLVLSYESYLANALREQANIYCVHLQKLLLYCEPSNIREAKIGRVHAHIRVGPLFSQVEHLNVKFRFKHTTWVSLDTTTRFVFLLLILHTNVYYI